MWPMPERPSLHQVPRKGHDCLVVARALVQHEFGQKGRLLRAIGGFFALTYSPMNTAATRALAPVVTAVTRFVVIL
jgi:hypothetical protein